MAGSSYVPKAVVSRAAVAFLLFVGVSVVSAQSVPNNLQIRPAVSGMSAVEWTLDDVVRTALAQHPLVEAARDRIAAAHGARQTAGVFSNPVATYWVENASFPGQTASVGVARETSTYVTWPLEPLFQRPPRIERADADLRSAELGLAAARRDVALNAVRAFYRVAFAQVSLAVAEQSRDSFERLLAFTRSRVNEGATAEVELIRAQVEFDRTATVVALADVDLMKARAELWPFLNDNPQRGTFSQLRVALPDTTGPSMTLATLAAYIARARDSRPEIGSARARISAARADTAAQRTLTVRQVGATFGLKRAEGENSMIAGVSVPLPLFDRNRGEIQRATAELLAAKHDSAWTERLVLAEVEGAYLATQRLGVQVQTLQPSFLSRADDANRITLAAYQEGGATLLQVLDAARTLTDARLTYYRAILAERQSRFDLAMAVGDEPETALATTIASLGQSREDVSR
jgi:cobalt-zinc-cadmium efflux system outer membrane protein